MIRVFVIFHLPINHRVLVEYEFQPITINNTNIYIRQVNNDIFIRSHRNLDLSPQRIKEFLRIKYRIKEEIILYAFHHTTEPPNNPEWRKCSNSVSGEVFDNICCASLQNINLYCYNSIDPLIVVATFYPKDVPLREKYPEWDKAKELLSNNKAKAYNYKIDKKQVEKIDPNSPEDFLRIIELKTDTYTLLFVKENGLAIEDNKVGADELLNKILEKWKEELNLNKEDIYVAIHDLKKYIKDKKQFEDKVHYICDFHHTETEPDKSFCDLLVDVINNINQGKKEEAEKNCDEIIEKIKILAIRPIKVLSLLKHKIAHLFLPLSVDLQGLEELKENPEKRREYAKEILKEYKDRGKHPFLQLLADLQFLVAEVEKINIENKIAQGEELKKQLFEKCAPNTPIAKFLKELDKALGEFKENENKGVTKFLEIVDKGSKKFHEWLKELNECLDELRERIEKKEGEAK